MGIDAMRANTPALLDALELASSEKGILIMSDAPSEELRNAQRTIDELKDELNRRMAW